MSGSENGLKRRSAVVLAMVTAAALAAGCSSSSSGDSASSGAASGGSSAAGSAAATGTKASGTPVKIGYINSEGGQGTDLPDNTKVADATVTYLNNTQGGLAGHPIQLVKCKSSETTTSARACANQMVQAKVAAVVIPVSGNGATLVPIITGAKIPYFDAAASDPAELTTSGSFTASSGFAGTLAGFAAYAKENNLKRVALFATNVPSVIGGANQVGKPLFKAAGVTLDIVPLPVDIDDATSQVTAEQSKNPDALAVVGAQPTCTAFLNGVQSSGSQAKKLIIGTCADASVAKAVGPALGGSILFSTADPTDATYLQMAKNAGVTPGFSVVGYQAVAGFAALVNANKPTGELTTANITTALAAAKDVKVPAGAGITATCDGKQFPQAPSICTRELITGTIGASGLENIKPLDLTPVIGPVK